MIAKGVARKLLTVFVVALLGIGFAACGGSDDSDSASTESEASPERTINEWFEAARLGEAEKKCAFETDEYQSFVYDGSGYTCLEYPANQQPQPVWAKEIEIVSIEQEEDTATVVVKPNASGNSTATLILVNQDGNWMINGFG